jgi:NitT/TauT family transport system substrate-binding protein
MRGLARRVWLARAARQALALPWLAGGLGALAQASRLETVTLSVVGPGHLLVLPVTLASRLGADEAEGLKFRINYVGGGPMAYRDMLIGNADFGAAGMPALAVQRLAGQPVVAVMPITHVPAYTLVVRKQLQGRIRSVADLAGKVIGVKGYVPGGRASSQIMAEYILRQAGVDLGSVNFVAVSLSYENQHAALASGTVDALMSDEPFATRLVQANTAYVLEDFHGLDATRRRMGGLFLNGVVACREDLIARRPDLVDKLVKSLRRALQWIDTHSAQEIVAQLAPATEIERTALLQVLVVRKNIYSREGRFSDEQLDAVDRFVRTTEPTSQGLAFRVRDMIDTTWAGRMP